MLNVVSYDLRYIDNLIGLLKYYEAIMNRSGLGARAGEVRSLKLGLILDLLKMVGIPENYKSGLTSALLKGWDMKCRDRSIIQVEQELRTVLLSIYSLENELARARSQWGPKARLRLDATVLVSLPLLPTDIKSNDIAGIHDLLARTMEYLSAKTNI